MSPFPSAMPHTGMLRELAHHLHDCDLHETLHRPLRRFIGPSLLPITSNFSHAVEASLGRLYGVVNLNVSHFQSVRITV